MGKYLKFEQLKNGNLKLTLTKEGKFELKDMISDDKGYDEMWNMLMEYEQCNGGYTLVQPEEVGALTSSPIIVEPDGIEWNANGRFVKLDAEIWWYPSYQIINELHELLKNRSIIFEK